MNQAACARPLSLFVLWFTNFPTSDELTCIDVRKIAEPGQVGFFCLNIKITIHNQNMDFSVVRAPIELKFRVPIP